MSPGSGTLPVASEPIWPPSQTRPPATVAWEKPRAGPRSSGLTFRGRFAGFMTLVCRATAEPARGHQLQISQTAHVDTFTRDNLPARASWPEFLFTLPEVHYSASINCAAQLLDRHVLAGAGSRRCLVTDTETWSYAELLVKSNQVAHVLVDEAGLAPGNRVLLRGPNNPWLVAAWFGVLKAGGVAVTTMPLLRAGELRVIADIAEVTHAVCDHRFVADLDAAAVRGLTTLLYGGSKQDDLAKLAARKPVALENVATAANDVCILAF